MPLAAQKTITKWTPMVEVNVNRNLRGETVNKAEFVLRQYRSMGRGKLLPGTIRTARIFPRPAVVV